MAVRKPAAPANPAKPAHAATEVPQPQHTARTSGPVHAATPGPDQILADVMQPRPTAREQVRPQARVPHNPDGRVVVLNRAGEPVSRASAAAGVDQFFVPPGVIPDGWSWEWKRHTVANQPDTAYEAELNQVGWEPVMAESYPGIFAPASAKGPIIRRGLMLMERDMRLTKEAQDEEFRRAKERTGNAVRKHQLSPQGTHGVSVDDRAAQQNTYIRKSTETINVPPPQYQRAVD